MGFVIAIYVCSDKGLVMQRKNLVHAIEGVGLEGDRYARGTGAYSHSVPIKVRHVSLISQEAIEAANQEFGVHYTAKETRRNILVYGVNLNLLVGQVFSIGEVQMQGTELCEPCTRPSVLSGKANFKTAFEKRGGLRAVIINSGTITTGDAFAFI